MVNILMDAIYEVIQAFEKFHSVCPIIPEVLYKNDKLYEYKKQYDDAIKYYSLLLMQLPYFIIFFRFFILSNKS